MGKRNVGADNAEELRGESQANGSPGSVTGCCGPQDETAVRDCPCGSLLKTHPVAVFAVLAVAILAVLISQVGGILGIIAFFRTF